jgi:hypothetical protein
VDWLMSRPNGQKEIEEIIGLSGDADTSVSFCKSWSHDTVLLGDIALLPKPTPFELDQCQVVSPCSLNLAESFLPPTRSNLTRHRPRPLFSVHSSDKHYSDKDTFHILDNVSKVLKLPIPEVLHFIGDYQLDSLLDKGFGPLVRTLGASFYEMLTNLE